MTYILDAQKTYRKGGRIVFRACPVVVLADKRETVTRELEHLRALGYGVRLYRREV